MTPRRRWVVISLAAIATAIAAWLVPQDKDLAQVAKPGERARAAAAAAPTTTASAKAQAEPLSTQLPVRTPIGRQRGDPFAARSWAAKPVASNEPPPKPQPPANPYKFAGTVHQDGVRKVFLILGDGRVVEAKEGEMLEQGFRVKSVSDRAVTLLYEQIPDQPVTITFIEPATAAASGASSPPAASSPPQQ